MNLDGEIAIPIQIKLNQSATKSWVYLNKLTTFSSELFQPDLSDVRDLGVDLRVETGWAFFTVVQRLRIPTKSIHYRFNGFFLLKRYDEDGEKFYIIVDLTLDHAWEIVPYVTTTDQIDGINARRSLLTHKDNFVTPCEIAKLSGGDIELILQECELSDI